MWSADGGGRKFLDRRTYPTGRLRRYRFCPPRCCLVRPALVLALLLPAAAHAQTPDSVRRGVVVPLGDSLGVVPRPLPGLVPARAPGAAPGAAPDTARLGADGRLNRPVAFKAARRMSLRLDSVVAGGARVGDVVRLEDDAEVTYGAQKLEAAVVELLFDRDELRAEGVRADTGLVGRPRLTQGSDVVESEQLFFNLRTERGRFLLARTRFEDGFIRARQVKVGADSTLYVRDGIFTTCPCVDDPSYSLRASRMKVVDGKTIYTGPIQLYLWNIPTLLVLPFGLLPTTEGRRSGLLAPTYGEDTYGFYLRGLGYYWSISRYLDLQVTTGLWSRGSFQVTPRLRYARRYRFSGNLEFDLARMRQGEPTDPDYAVRLAPSLRWSHSQTFSPTTTLSANVNLASEAYQRTLSPTLRERTSQTSNSTIGFSTSWPKAGRSLNASLNAATNFVTGAGTLTLPSLTFNQSARQPLKRRGAVTGPLRWYENLTYSVASTLSNGFSFQPAPADTLLKYDPAAATFAWYDALVDPAKYRRATRVGTLYGGLAGSSNGFSFLADHSVPVGLSFTLERFRTTLSASVAYNETWYTQTERRLPSPTDSSRTVTTRADGFFAYRRATSSLNASTTAYGIFPLRVGRLDGLRHTLRPTVGVAFAPNYGADAFGYTRTVTRGDGVTERYGVVSGVPTVATAALTFGLDNVFETRLRREDSTGAVTRTPLQLLSLSLNSSYNAAADSFRLAPVSFSARTTLFDQVEVNAGGVLSPYRVSPDGRRLIDRYALGYDERLLLPRLASFNVSLSTRLSGGRRGPPRPSQRMSMAGFLPGQMPDAPLTDGAYPGAPLGPGLEGLTRAQPGTGMPTIGAAPYADFSIPWSLSLSGTYSSYTPLETTTRAFTVGATFDFNLTPNWKVQGTSSFDALARQFTATNVSVARDFECWEMSFSWVPFGAYQSYGFNLQVKSGKLRQLLRLQQPRQDARTRLGSILR